MVITKELKDVPLAVEAQINVQVVVTGGLLAQNVVEIGK
jgi:hypothetical protein